MVADTPLRQLTLILTLTLTINAKFPVNYTPFAAGNKHDAKEAKF